MRVFITGLTGSLGGAMANLHASRGDLVWGCARNESRAVEWVQRQRRQENTPTLFVADAKSLARSESDIARILPSMDVVYHCAAMKHVDLCEQNPASAFRQNVEVTLEVASACERAHVPLVFVSSDKACLPVGVYGATKLLAERAVIGRGGAAVRLGNLIGSSGSVFSLWHDAVRRGEALRVTDYLMTRYFMSVQEAAAFVADRHRRECVTIPDPLLSARMGDVASAIVGDGERMALAPAVGRRPGETLHQWLVAPGERVKEEDGRLILGEGREDAEGYCSSTAPRWDTQELLKVAGLASV